MTTTSTFLLSSTFSLRLPFRLPSTIVTRPTPVSVLGRVSYDDVCDFGLHAQPCSEADAAALGGDECEGAGRGADGQGLLAAFHGAVLDWYGYLFGRLAHRPRPIDAMYDWSQKLFYVASASLQPSASNLS